MDLESAAPPGKAAPADGGSRRTFALHLIEMVVVMFAGMGALSGLAAVSFAAAGSGLTDQPGWLRVTMMGVNMTVPMVLWMSLRGHPTGRNLEMAAAMLVPTFLAAALVWSGALGVMAGMGIQHAVMLPAMLGAMLWRYHEYAQPHRRHRG